MNVSIQKMVHVLGLTVFLTAIFGPSSTTMAQNDLLVTAPNRNSIERFDGFTGEYLGAFVQPGAGGLAGPGGVDVGPDGNVYVTSSQTQEILRYDGVTGEYIDVFASGNGLTAPNNVSFFGDHMYVGNFAGGNSGFVQRYDALTGAFDSNFLDVNFVDGITFTEDAIFASDFSGGVGKFDINTGQFLEQFVAPGEGGLANPTALLFLPEGDLLVSSYSTNSVKRYSADGVYLGDVITGLSQPEGLEIGLDGNLYAGSYGLGIINQYDPNSFDFISEFATVGPVTNFFTFRGSAVPEPTIALPMLIGSLCAWSRRRRRLPNVC